MRSFRSTIVLLLTACAALAATQRYEKPAVYLLKDARVVAAPGKVMESTDVLIMDGVIAKLGPSLKAPEVAQIIDCKGLTVYPGFVHPLLSVGVKGLTDAIEQRKKEKDPKDKFARAANFATRFSLADFSQTDVAELENLAKSGFGIAHVYAPGGILGARAAVYSTGKAALTPAALIAPNTGVPIQLSVRSFGGFGGATYPNSLMGAIAFTRQALLDANRYKRIMGKYDASPKGLPRPEADPDLAEAEELVEGQAWAVFDKLDEAGALRAVSIANEFRLRPLYAFSRDAGYVTDLLKAPQMRVLLRDSMPDQPKMEEENSKNSLSAVRTYFNELQVGAELEKKGIEFGYAPAKTSDPLEGIRALVRGGLKRDAALAAMTTRPAKLLGLQRLAGTIEEGKLGNLVVVEGDLFATSGKVMAVFVDGKRLDFKMPERRKPEEIKPDKPLKLMPPDYELFPRPAETRPAFKLYKNATVWTMSSAGTLHKADVLVKDGKIAKVGTNLAAPQGCLVIDAVGKHITPGVFDCHSHTAISGSVNEFTNMVTIECRIRDVINHRDIGIYRQLAGGTIGGQQLHGSANPIGGQTAVSKWRWGKRPADFTIRGAPEGVKFALGENPLEEEPRFAEQPTQTDRPRTRMGIEETIRRTFDDARGYIDRWEAYRKGKTSVEPRRDLQLEAVAEILQGKRRIHSHGYRQDELLMLIRLCEGYGVKIGTFQHVLDGYKIADEMARHGVGGSTFADWWGYKLEAYDAIPHNAALMHQRGVSVSINSDSGDHARRLNHEAAKSVRYGGVSPETALSFVTIEPARQLGIERWTGSLQAGKDADFVIWSGDPTSILSRCEETYVDGVKLFDIRHDRAEQERREAILNAARELLSEKKTDEKDDKSDGKKNDGAKPEEDVKPISVPGIGKVDTVPGSARYPRSAVLIQGATVHPMTGEPFVGDVLVGADGRIAQVGSGLSADGAQTVDAKGMHLYPGLIDAATTLGLIEINQVPVSVDTSERGEFNPHLRPERALNPDSELLAVARSAGVLTALTRPTGAGLPGQAALISLDGYTWEDFTLKPGLGIVADFGGSGTRFAGLPGGGADSSVDSLLKKLSDYLADARDYATARNTAKKDERPYTQRDMRLEAMLAAANGELPFIAVAASAKAMKAAVEWAEKEKVGIQLLGAREAGDIAEWLAKKRVPVILGPVTDLPREAELPYDSNYSLPAKLMKAGVKFCFATNDAHNVRWIRELPGYAAAYGLDREDAVRAVTLWPAEILGLGHRLGAVKPGMDATLILTDGDILEIATNVRRAWVFGREVELSNRQTRLYEKYRARPASG